MTINENLSKVAAVLDDRHVVINKGAKDGVSIGQEYIIYAYGDEIQDPDTGNSLGRLEIIRGFGKVSRVQEHLATVQTASTRSNRPTNSLLAQYLGTQRELVPFKDPQVGDLVRPTDK
jgi:hypothetical protein